MGPTNWSTANVTTNTTSCVNANFPSFVTDIASNDATMYQICCLLFTTFVMFPLSLIDKMNTLRFTSFIGVASICYLIFAITGDSLAHTHDYVWASGTGANDNGIGILTAIPTIMFAYTCQVNVFSIYQELDRPTANRINKVAKP